MEVNFLMALRVIGPGFPQILNYASENESFFANFDHRLRKTLGLEIGEVHMQKESQIGLRLEQADGRTPKVQAGHNAKMMQIKNIKEAALPERFFPVDRRIAFAVCCPDNFRGYYVAAKTILQTVKNARELYPAQVSSDWLQLVEAHTSKVKNLAIDNTLMATVDDATARQRTYGQFARPSKANLSVAELARLSGAIGLIILATVIQSRTLPASVVSAWIRLQKCGTHREGRHADWERLAKKFPQTFQDAQEWQEKTSEPEILAFLKTLENSLAAPLLSPLALQPVVSEESSQKPGEKAVGTEFNEDTTESLEESARTVTTPPESFVGWLIQRANQSGFSGHLGLQGHWDLQTPDELRSVCKVIIEALGGSPSEQKFALFAITSLNSGLPANLLVNVGLKPSTDLWADFAKGCIHWCILRCLDSDKAKSMRAEDVPRRQIMDIWLPQRTRGVTQALRRLHPDAANVIEFLMGKGDEVTILNFLDEYRRWLTSLGGESLHYIYDARFARSLGQIYREEFNDLVAAFSALDFSECSMGMLHYVQFERAYLHQASSKVYLSLGFDQPIASDEINGTVGSSGAMALPSFIDGLGGLWTLRKVASEQMHHADSPAAATSAFNDVVHIDQLLELSLSAGRDQHLERQTWGNLHGHAEYLLKADKDIDQYTKFRMIPAHVALKRVLNAHATAKTQYCQKLVELGVYPHSQRGRRFDSSSSHLCFFTQASLQTKNDAIYVRRRPLESAKLIALSWKHLNGHINCGRHTIVSAVASTTEDPWLLKVLTGHYRGQCEPFSDGMAIPPTTAMCRLSGVLNTLFQPLSNVINGNWPDATIALSRFSGRLPDQANESIRSDRSRARILAAPFDGYTPIAIRLIDQIRDCLRHGRGPEHPGANLLLTLLADNWILAPDLKVIWNSKAPFTETSPGCAHVIWTRPDCVSEIRLVLTEASLIAVGNAWRRGTDRSWDAATNEVREWLLGIAATVSWPDTGAKTITKLSALMARWLRMHLPPFLLAAASTKMTSPTASAPSFARLLHGNAQTVSRTEILNFPKPKPRGKGNLRLSERELKRVIDLVHEFANPAKHEGEDWQLMKELDGGVSKIDCSCDKVATAVSAWVKSEAAMWVGSKGGRIQVSSLSTYLYLLAPALSQLTPIEDLTEWTYEWFGWVALLTAPNTQNMEGKAANAESDRMTASKRFTAQLAQLGYCVPIDLYEERPDKTPDGMRKSAASALILKQERTEIRRLMVQQFEDWPLDARLAGMYVDLRFALSARSIEVAVLPLEGTDPYSNVVITTDGFSHLKSKNARRLCPVSEDLVAEFRSLANSVISARPEARWLYLKDDRSDWRLVMNLEQAFSAALKQVTRDPHAVPHSTRSIAPLNTLFPEWESMTSAMLSGNANKSEYLNFLESVETFGFTNIARILLNIGHGHPLTYIKYYFAIWDVLFSIYLRANELRDDYSRVLVRKYRTQFKDAYEKARQRKGEEFCGQQWLIKKELESLKLPRFKCEITPASAKVKEKIANTKKTIPLRDKVRYISARFNKMDPDAAAHEFEIDTATRNELEGQIARVDTDALLSRHQYKVSQRSMSSEVRFLKTDEGESLTKKLLQSDRLVLELLGEALVSRRTYMAMTPPASEIQKRMAAFLDCLPTNLGLMVQVSPLKYTSDELALIPMSSGRAVLGPTDPDLGARPRYSIVEAKAPNNKVLRARRTSSTRCLIAAILLLVN